MKTCHRCGAEVTRDPVGVRDTCERCRAYLHCCRNCEFYEVGAHNDCREPNSEMVADKEEGNFCDYFRFGSAPRAAQSGRSDARAKLEGLFRKK
jgi:hypothetical protein